MTATIVSKGTKYTCYKQISYILYVRGGVDMSRRERESERGKEGSLPAEWRELTHTATHTS